MLDNVCAALCAVQMEVLEWKSAGNILFRESFFSLLALILNIFLLVRLKIHLFSFSTTFSLHVIINIIILPFYWEC